MLLRDKDAALLPQKPQGPAPPPNVPSSPKSQKQKKESGGSPVHQQSAASLSGAAGFASLLAGQKPSTIAQSSSHRSLQDDQVAPKSTKSPGGKARKEKKGSADTTATAGSSSSQSQAQSQTQPANPHLLLKQKVEERLNDQFRQVQGDLLHWISEFKRESTAAAAQRREDDAKRAKDAEQREKEAGSKRQKDDAALQRTRAEADALLAMAQTRARADAEKREELKKRETALELKEKGFDEERRELEQLRRKFNSEKDDPGNTSDAGDGDDGDTKKPGKHDSGSAGVKSKPSDGSSKSEGKDGGGDTSSSSNAASAKVIRDLEREVRQLVEHKEHLLFEAAEAADDNGRLKAQLRDALGQLKTMAEVTDEMGKALRFGGKECKRLKAELSAVASGGAQNSSSRSFLGHPATSRGDAGSQGGGGGEQENGPAPGGGERDGDEGSRSLSRSHSQSLSPSHSANSRSNSASGADDENSGEVPMLWRDIMGE